MSVNLTPAQARGCSIDGCKRIHEAHGLCEPHYKRLRKYGDPLGGGPARNVPAPIRFWEGIDTTDPDACWPWPRHLTRQGYGTFALKHRRTVPAHRFAYEDRVGPIGDGLQLDHLCRTRACVNPAHLEPVTNKVNQERRVAALATCVNGHPRTPENLLDFGDGHRRCRVCQRERGREFAKRKRQALREAS